MSSEKIGSVLFICLGNICRSPIAEAVFRKEISERGEANKWEIDSAALGTWHIGRGPDRRAVACLAKRNITTDHRARQVVVEDFNRYDIIFGMDDDNIRELKRLQPKSSRALVKYLGEFDPQKKLIIEDPYYGSDSDFETVFEQCTRCCKALREQWNTVVKRQ